VFRIGRNEILVKNGVNCISDGSNAVLAEEQVGFIHIHLLGRTRGKFFMQFRTLEASEELVRENTIRSSSYRR
jgi:hypothetical protein